MPVTGPAEDLVIVLHEQELPPAVALAKKPFLVKDILLSVHSNHIPGCVASINIYRIEGKNESFVNVLHEPIYFDVAISDEPQHFDIQPGQTVLLEPGRYFDAFQIVGYDEQALQRQIARYQGFISSQSRSGKP